MEEEEGGREGRKEGGKKEPGLVQIESSDSPYFMKLFAKETDPSRPTVPTNWGTGKRERV